MQRFLAIMFVVVLTLLATSPANAGGFDQFGYNYGARVFSGPADGSDRVLDGAVWGDPTYAKDHLVMKWSQAWDDARFGTAPWTTAAWVNNEWNGNVPGGSGWTELVKIIWVGDCSTTLLANANPNFRPGGYCIWGEFEAISDHGMKPTGRFSDAHAIPNGYGGR